MDLYKNSFTNSSYISNYNNNNTRILIVGTHNNRLECFFSKHHPGFNSKYFKNCAIIKCYNLN